MISNWSVPLVSVAVTFSMKTLYAIGTRVSLTPWDFAHVSIMSSEASWMGFFMYPTLSSRSCAWAEKRPVERTRPIAAATHSRMTLFSSGIDTSLAEPFLGCQRGLTITHLCRSRGNVVVRLQALAAIQVPKHRRFKGDQDSGTVAAKGFSAAGRSCKWHATNCPS